MMTNSKKALLLNTSLNGEQGQSHQLANRLGLGLANSEAVTLSQRDLTEMDLPHLTKAEMTAWMTPADQRTDQQQQLAALSDQLIEEVKSNDLIILGMPMYNFGIPSVFKAWIDRIARAGITFKYTETGPVGLLDNKQVIVLAARGGMYVGTERDTQTRYLTDFFSFVGINDVRFIYAEGLAMAGAEERLVAAHQQIDQLISDACQ